MSTPPNKPSLFTMVGAFTRAEQLIAGGCVLVIVSAFLTWKSYPGVAGGDVTGLHSFGLVTLLLALLALVYFVARSPFFRNLVTAPQLPVTDAAAYVLVGAAEIFTVLLFSSHYGGGRSAAIGFYLALIGAAITAFGGFMILRGRDTPAQKPPTKSPTGGVNLGDDDP